jgi:hypothetical protein
MGFKNSPQVSHFIANSKYVAQRIKSIYQREASNLSASEHRFFYTSRIEKDYFFSASEWFRIKTATYCRGF